MDPHSRLSQFNQRPPKSGPLKPLTRQMEPKTIAVFEHFKKSSQPSSVNDLISLSTRPIATNSRLRRDDKYSRNMYLAFIENALSQKAMGVTEHYDDLVRQFNPKTFSQETQQPLLQLRSHLTALTHVVSKLDKSNLALVEAIVGMPWTTMDSAFVKAYISFICMLVSARPEYLTLVLERTTQALTFSSARKALDSGFPESSATPITRRVVYDRVHSLLDQLLCLIPTLPSTLYPLLSRNFPHKRHSQAEHVTYIRNLLRLTDYCPELWDRVLGLIVDRTIQIDVEIQVELEDLESDGLADGEVFHLDVFDTVIGQEGDDSDSEDEDETEDGGLSDLSSDAGSVDDERRATEEVDVKHVQDMVTKLDSILEVIFKHLDQLHASHERPSTPTSSPVLVTSQPSPVQRQTLSQSRFHSLLAIFERTILRTFKSRYTQFLVFWYSSLDTQFRDHFLGAVVSKALLEPEQPVVTRAAAASYVASYVSRASFVDRAETRNVVAILCKFLEKHLDDFDAYEAQAPFRGNMPQQSSEQHAVFYASAQAIFLIFCFRWRDLMEQDSDKDVDEFGAALNCTVNPHRTWQSELNIMQRVVNSTLNPLKVCATPVVQQFARIAQKVGFLYCFPILEANRRLDYSASTRPSQTTFHSASASQPFDADLTSFFPFDPYKLPKSCPYIDKIYREWTSVAIEESDDDDDSDSDDDDEDSESNGDDDDDEIGNTNNGLTISGELVPRGQGIVDGAAGLGKSFGGMSISPARPRKVDLSL